jgi:hypothetical protein
LLAWVLGGAGVAALATGGVLWLTTNADVSSARAPDGCAPNCSQGRVDGMRTNFVVSDVLFGVGLVSLGVGAYFFFARSSDLAPANHAALRWDVVASPQAGQLQLLGAF